MRDTDIEILGERFLPLDTHDPACWDRVLNEIVRSGAHGVISLLVGSDAVRFNRAFGDKGLDATVTRFSPFTDETVILASGADATANLFVSAGWFAGLDSASAVEFTAGFGRAFDLVNGIGPADESAAPPPGTMAETTYSGVHLLAGIAGTSVPTVEDARRAFGKWGWDSPHGPVDLHRWVRTTSGPHGEGARCRTRRHRPRSVTDPEPRRSENFGARTPLPADLGS